MELHIMVVDDEKIAREATAAALRQMEMVGQVQQVSSSAEVLALLKAQSFDLVLLDIEMPDNTGFELAQYIQRYAPEVQYAFLTGHAGFAIQGYEYDPVDFLTKPINLLRLEKTLRKVLNRKRSKAGQVQNVERKRIGILVDNGYEFIDVNDILYIEKKLRKLYMATQQGGVSFSGYTMDKLETMFHEHHFFRVHQSFLVPLVRIQRIMLEDSKRTYSLLLHGCELKIPLSRNHYKELKDKMMEQGIHIYK